jgi:hypothetical protein
MGRREDAMILFLLIFFLLYGGLHYYIFRKAKAAFAFGTWPGMFLLFFMLIMILAPLILRLSARQEIEPLRRFIAFAGYTWMGAVLLFFTCSIVLDLYRLLLYGARFLLPGSLSPFALSAQYSFIIPLLFSLGAATCGYFQAKGVHTERVIIKTSKIPREVGRLRIVQVSDIHLGMIIREERLMKILEEVKKVDPDILVSTGDLVDEQINSLTGLAELLKEIHPRYGKYAIMGNHEFYAGLDHALPFIEYAGFRILRGEGLTAAGVINIAGVDDPIGKRFGLMKEISEKWLLSRLPREKFTLLLKHQPRVETSALGLFDLQLSGHTHKGQFFPFSIITHFIYPADSGLVHLPNNSYLYVSRGAGTWGPPIRFLSPPEVTIIELIHEDKQE